HGLCRGIWRRGPEGGFNVVPGQARWQEDRRDVGRAVPGLELLADLVAGSVGGQLAEHGLRAAGDGPAPWARPRVRGDDRLDLGGIAFTGHGPGVDLAHGAHVPGGAARGDAPGPAGVFIDGRYGSRRRRDELRV